MVNLSRKGHHDRRRHALLDEQTDLALGVELRAERRHAEIVLDANGGGALLGDASAKRSSALAGDEGKRQINTSLHLFRDAAPVRRGKRALGLELSGRSPVIRLVSGAHRNGRLGRLSEDAALPNALETKTQLRGHGLEVAPNVDTRQTAVEVRRVEHLQRRREVIPSVFVLDLGHTRAVIRKLELRLADELVVPSEVEAARQLTFVIYLALEEDLQESSPLAPGNGGIPIVDHEDLTLLVP